MDKLLTFVLATWVACLYYGFVRNAIVMRVRHAFIDDKTLFPDAYQHLPSYGEMLFSPRHQFRWTKAQWVQWVKSQ